MSREMAVNYGRSAVEASRAGEPRTHSPVGPTGQSRCGHAAQKQVAVQMRLSGSSRAVRGFVREPRRKWRPPRARTRVLRLWAENAHAMERTLLSTYPSMDGARLVET